MVVLLGALPYVQYVMYSRAIRAELELKVCAPPGVAQVERLRGEAVLLEHALRVSRAVQLLTGAHVAQLPAGEEVQSPRRHGPSAYIFHKARASP